MSNITVIVHTTALPAAAAGGKPSYLPHPRLMPISAAGKRVVPRPVKPSAQQISQRNRPINSPRRAAGNGVQLSRAPRLASPSVIAAMAPKKLPFGHNNSMVEKWLLENTLAELISAGKINPASLRSPSCDKGEQKRASALTLATTHDVLFRADGSLGAIRPTIQSGERKSLKGGFIRPWDLQRDRNVSYSQTCPSTKKSKVELITGVTPRLAKREGERDGRTCIPRMRRDDERERSLCRREEKAKGCIRDQKIVRSESRIPRRIVAKKEGKENRNVERPAIESGVAGARWARDSKVGCGGNTFGIENVKRW